MTTTIIYSSKGGNVENVARKLYHKLNPNEVTIAPIENLKHNSLRNTELFILGSSTVGADHWDNNVYEDLWNKFFSEIKALNISMDKKKVAIFGLGNQVLYPDHFVDGMSELATLAQKAGAEIVGGYENKGYDFTASESLIGNIFIGLPIDEDTQADKTDERLNNWIKILKLE